MFCGCINYYCLLILKSSLNIFGICAFVQVQTCAVWFLVSVSAISISMVGSDDDDDANAAHVNCYN